MDAANTSNPSDKKKFNLAGDIAYHRYCRSRCLVVELSKIRIYHRCKPGWQSCECVRPCDGPFVCCLQAGG